MTHQRTLNPLALWMSIMQAGGTEAYINQQLRERGFLIERKDTAKMSRRELDAYKKSLKQEAAQKRKLKREAWEAYKSQHIVHVGENIFWNDNHDLDKWDLPDANERAAENGLPALDKPKQLAEFLGLSISELRWFAYHRDAARMIHYHRFTIPKGDGSERAIWAPLPKLKEIQRKILHGIVEKLMVHGAAHGFLPGRSILSNANVHTNARIILKMDLKNFFPTITLPRVKGLFRKAGYREQIALLLALICTEAPREIVEHDGKTWYVSLGPRCLPQGAPTSPAVTNALCMSLDRRIQGVAEKYGWRYTRYADDLTFSLPNDHKGQPKLGHLMGCLHKIVQDEGFEVHPEKTRIARKGARQKVTGLVVNGEQSPRVPRKLKREIRAAVHHVATGKPLENGMTIARLEGYIAYIEMTDPELAEKLRSQLTIQTPGE